MTDDQQPEPKKQKSGYYDALDMPFFGLTIAHATRADLSLDPHADGIDDAARKLGGRSASWADFDKEVGMNARPMATITMNKQTQYLTKEQFEWLIVQGKSILDNMEKMAAQTDETWAAFRRRVRGEVGNPKLGEKG